MVRFNVGIVIQRPVENVFSFVSHGENATMWHSAVRQVRKTTEASEGVGTGYWMSRELPRGRVENTLRVVEYERNKMYAIQVTSGPTPLRYRYEFEPEGRGTRVSLSVEGELGGVADLFPSFASIAVRRGVEANLRTLKGLLEGRP